MYRNPNRDVIERLRKIARLGELGVNPYPVEAFEPTHPIPEIQKSANDLVSHGTMVRVAGRVIDQRLMGKVIFVDLQDEGEKLQAYFKKSALGDHLWNVLELVDRGDFLGLTGTVFYTRTGELSLNVTTLLILGKASHTVPLPKVHEGGLSNAVTDKGTLYRHRHIDLLSSRKSRETFQKRTLILREIRRYLDDQGFLEVETPVLGRYYGGAAARPFRTEINALDQEMFLRISPECYLKRLLCAGFNKVYELGKNFRNEGIDASHNPEFTMVEWYEANSDYHNQMVRFETMVAQICQKVNGSTRIEFDGRRLDLTPPWRRLPMLDALQPVLGVDLRNVTVQEMSAVFQRHHPDGPDGLPDPLTWGSAVTALFEALVEPTLWDPVFVMDHPVEISPLTKRHRRDPRVVERFEPMIAGLEVGNSYSELNDPVEQYERLVSQQGDRDQMYDLDHEFLQAVAHGMPQAGGSGLGVDRVVMLLTGAKSIRDVIFFPIVGEDRRVRQIAGSEAGVEIPPSNEQSRDIESDEFQPFEGGEDKMGIGTGS